MDNILRKRSFNPSKEGEKPNKIPKTNESAVEFPGKIVSDTMNRQWRLGELIGAGGFAKVYVASEDTMKPVELDDAKSVLKVQLYCSKSLCSEIDILSKIGELQDGEKSSENIKNPWSSLPKIMGHGSHVFGRKHYRFLVLERYRQSLFSLVRLKKLEDKSILILAVHLIDALENLHCFKYCHNDVKAENIMITTDKWPMKADESNTDSKETMELGERLSNRLTSEASEREILKLIDLGVSTLYEDDNVHRRFSPNFRSMHMGTLTYMGRDGHLGAFSRRGDLESLGYNLIYWSQGFLPWIIASKSRDCQKVHLSKEFFMSAINDMMPVIYGNDVPKFLGEYLFHVKNLKFEEAPNYDFFRNLFKNEYQKLGGDPQLMELNSNNIERTSMPTPDKILPSDCDILLLRKDILEGKLKVSPILSEIFLQNPEDIISKRVADERKGANDIKVKEEEIITSKIRTTCAKLRPPQRGMVSKGTNATNAQKENEEIEVEKSE